MSLRVKLLLPLLLAAALLAAWVFLTLLDVPAAAAAGRAPCSVPAALALLLFAAFQAELRVGRPLRDLVRQAGDAAGGERSTAPGDGDEVGRLATRLALMRHRIDESDQRLAQGAEQRQKVDASLRECEERYALTVERANDGVWEWDIKSGAVQFSPRWQGMLGQVDAGLARIEDWRDLLHADDRDAILIRLDNHIDGLTPHFDAEYRLRHRDGRYRWVQSRGTALRHASGKPYRMLVMDIDIHGRKELEETLIQAAEGLSAVSGLEFFQALMRNLSAILGTRDNLVCYCPDDPPTRARTLAYYSRGKFWDNFEYELDGTSCGAVITRRETVYVPTGVCDIWPLEKQYDRDSYIGVPMFDSAGKIIGHFACMDGKPMRQDLPHLAIFKIFSVRAAAELERTLLKRRLETSRLH